MRTIALALVMAVLFAAPAAAEMYRYVDENGSVNFVDDPSKIPPQFRNQAKEYVPPAPPAPGSAEAGDMQAIIRKRREIISSYSADQAEAALKKGILTTDEVDFLVQKGALRTSAAGVIMREAALQGHGDATPAAKQQTGLQAGQDVGELESISAKAPTGTPQGTSAGAATGEKGNPLTALLARARANPKSKYVLLGEAALAALLLAALPLLRRRYPGEDTRKVIASALVFAFIAVSAVGNLLLFRSEITQYLNQPTAFDTRK